MSVQFSDASSQGVMEWVCRPSDDRAALEQDRQSAATRRAWQCRIGDGVVGSVALCHTRPHAVSISLFRIDPQWQHTAVASKLIRRVCDYCVAHGCSEVHWQPGAAPRWLRGLFGRRHLQSFCRSAGLRRSTSRFALDG